MIITLKRKIRSRLRTSILLRVLLATVSFLSTAPIFPGIGTWTTAGPEGGPVNIIAIEPSNPNILYAGTPSAGIFKSTDGGTTWRPSSSGIQPPSPVSWLRFAPSSPGTIYTYGYTSSDYGVTWSRMELSAILPPTSYMNGVTIFEVNPADANTLFMGGFNQPTHSSPTNSFLVKSNDGGATWNSILNGLQGYSMETMKQLVIDPLFPDTLFLLIQGTGIYRSTNGGDTWVQATQGAPFSNGYHLGIDSAGNLYVATVLNAVTSLYKSTDGAAHWSSIGPAINPSTYIQEMVATANTFYLRMAAGFYKTTDGGANWIFVNAPGDTLNSLAADSAGHVYAGLVSRGVSKSLDGGLTWTASNSGLFNVPIAAVGVDQVGRVFASSGIAGTLRSLDRGQSWNSLDGFPPATFIIADPSNAATVYLAGSRIYKSLLGGQKWVEASIGIDSGTVNGLAIDPQAANNLYASVGKKIYKSSDGGGLWSLVYTFSDTHFFGILAVDPHTTSTLYAGVNSGGIYKSTDGAATWNPANGGLSNGIVRSIVIDPASPSTVYAASTKGIYKSTDGGGSWVGMNTGLEDTNVQALVMDPSQHQTLFAGTLGGGVFKSLDGAETWTSMNSGLFSPAISSLAIDPSCPGTIHAATPIGVYSFSNSRCGSTQTEFTLPENGAISFFTPGQAGPVQAGYATVEFDDLGGLFGSPKAVDGVAVFSYAPHGIIITEAGVPSSPPSTSVRLFVDYRTAAPAKGNQFEAGTVDVSTGFAIVNRGPQAANITYTLRNASGSLIGTPGHGVLASGAHISKFIDQVRDVAPDFMLPSDFATSIGFGSLEITSSNSQPLSVLALRLIRNQRNETIITTTPVADLTKPFQAQPLFFPQLADGGGYRTTYILLNPTMTVASGAISFFGDDGTPLNVQPVNGVAASALLYRIPANGVFVFQSDGSPGNVHAGWARVAPDIDTPTPSGAGIFSYTLSGILTTESGVPSALPTRHARVYVDESTGHQTGLAIAIPGTGSTTVTLQAYQTDGVTSVGSPATLSLSANGHTARFSSQLISGLPPEFTGVLDISSQDPITALTLRGLTNARGDFLLTTFPIVDVNQHPSSPLIFPQIADGGGYQTQFILLNIMGGAFKVSTNFLGDDGTGLPVGNR